MTGHLLGAAGGVEALYSVLAVHEQNLHRPSTSLNKTLKPVCDLDYCANEARDAKIDVAISNSFGFGGYQRHIGIQTLQRLIEGFW